MQWWHLPYCVLQGQLSNRCFVFFLEEQACRALICTHRSRLCSHWLAYGWRWQTPSITLISSSLPVSLSSTLSFLQETGIIWGNEMGKKKTPAPATFHFLHKLTKCIIHIYPREKKTWTMWNYFPHFRHKQPGNEQITSFCWLIRFLYL